ncbi:hypothetical protein VUR80DRAFT_9042 [Thermomyces stellatus]
MGGVSRPEGSSQGPHKRELQTECGSRNHRVVTGVRGRMDATGGGATLRSVWSCGKTIGGVRRIPGRDPSCCRPNLGFASPFLSALARNATFVTRDPKGAGRDFANAEPKSLVLGPSIAQDACGTEPSALSPGVPGLPAASTLGRFALYRGKAVCG